METYKINEKAHELFTFTSCYFVLLALAKILLYLVEKGINKLPINLYCTDNDIYCYLIMRPYC